MSEIKLQKIVGNSLDKLQKLYMNGTVFWKFLTFAKTSGTVTGDRKKNWPIADRHIPSNDDLGSVTLLVSKVENGSLLVW